MRNQTENRSSGAHTRTRLKQGVQERTWEPGATAAGTSTKDRDMPALEPAVGRTTKDAVGFLAATTEAELKWPRELRGERTVISVLRQRLGYGHCCSDSHKRHSRPPGKATREQKPGNTSSQYAHPHPPSQGTGQLYPNRVS